MEAFVIWHRTAPAAHDDDTDSSAGLSWMRHVRARAEAAKSIVLGPVGGAIAAVFEADDLTRAIEFALAILNEAEKSPEFAHSPRVAIGIAMGELEYVPSADGNRVEYVGGAIDRAQLLANRARPGELVLDTLAREAVQSTYLFHRTVGTGEASLRGHAMDREEPRIADCRRHFVQLGRPPTPRAITEAFAPLRDVATLEGANTVVVRGLVGSGARRSIAELEFSLRPSVMLRCVGVPGGLEPLGSLRAALLKAYGPGAAALSRLTSLDPTAADTLAKIARGEVVEFETACAAIRALFATAREADTNKPWIMLDPVHEVDESTLEIVGRIARDPRNDMLAIAHLRPETGVPESLLRAHRLREIEVPRLQPDDARMIVEKMLREASGGDIARRVAAIADDTPLAVVECVRAWIASGDVVRRGKTFVFRVGPRVTERTSYADSIAERLALLDTNSARLLEVLAIIPPGFATDDVIALASKDASDPAMVEKALARLRDDRFVHGSQSLELDTAALRDLVLSQMPGARRADLAARVATRMKNDVGFGRASLGHYLAEAGSSEKAAMAMLDAAEQAVKNGHSRACIRLAAAAVKTVPSPTTRARAAAMLRFATLRVPAGADDDIARPSIEIPTEAVESAAAVVIAAIRGRDYDRVERYVDLAIAEGASLAAADRWRALLFLLRGDPEGASSAVTRARERTMVDPATRARTELVAALLDLYEGRPRSALRALLSVLADVRERDDLAGTDAVLRVLALCYLALGRASDAATLGKLASQAA
jgi:hypothetical protein